jgi:hypothetical protein
MSDQFDAVIESSIDAIERRFRDLFSMSPTGDAVSEILEYGQKVKKEVSRQFYELSSELQYQSTAVFSGFIGRCNSLMGEAAEKIGLCDPAIPLSNDIFYNDRGDSR